MKISIKGYYLAILLCFSTLAECETITTLPSAFIQSSSDASLIHQRSGFSFPKQIGNFQREKATQYDQSGDDVSVGYNALNYAAPVAATVYIYPMYTSTINAEFRARQAEIIANHTEAQLIKTSVIDVTPRHISALSASYIFNGIFAGKFQMLKSELLVAQIGNRYVEYRFTYPSSTAAASYADIVNFEQSFKWP